jgi:hypothetical protein
MKRLVFILLVLTVTLTIAMHHGGKKNKGKGKIQCKQLIKQLKKCQKKKGG